MWRAERRASVCSEPQAAMKHVRENLGIDGDEAIWGEFANRVAFHGLDSE